MTMKKKGTKCKEMEKTFSFEKRSSYGRVFIKFPTFCQKYFILHHFIFFVFQITPTQLFFCAVFANFLKHVKICTSSITGES